MLSWRNTEGGQFHKPPDGPDTDDADSRGIREDIPRAQHQQDNNHRGKRHSTRNTRGLSDAPSSCLHQEETTQDNGEDARINDTLVHQRPRLHRLHQQRLPHSKRPHPLHRRFPRLWQRCYGSG